MCSTLEWDTLEQRRRLRDVTLLYKIKHGLVGITPGGGGGGTPPKLGYNAQHKLKIWILRDLKTSEKGGLKDLKRVFDKFQIGGLKDLNRVIDANCQVWVLNC